MEEETSNVSLPQLVNALNEQLLECQKLYAAEKLPLVTGRPSATTFATLLTIGTLTGGVGTAMLITAGKDDSAQRFLGAFGVGVGVLSLGGAAYHFPKEQTTYSYTFVVPAEEQYEIIVYIPKGLKPDEVETVVGKQLEQAFKAFKRTKKQSDFTHENEDAKEDTLGKISALGPTRSGMAIVGPPQAPEEKDEPVSEPSSDEPEATSASSSSSSSDDADVKSKNEPKPQAKANTDIDIKYGSVIKVPPAKPGVGEHGFM